jgi:UDP-arabinose 4-epimerase
MSDSFTHVLVTGGAGYIGSHVAKALASSGMTPVTYDNLLRGHREAVRWGPFVEGDIGDSAKLRETIRRYDVEAVVHLAAFAYVGESIEGPARYFQNNVSKGLVMLEALLEAGVRHLVFSSSCATYGVPDETPITENTAQLPINPYGETKLIMERALRWYGEAYGLQSVTLRYFNAAGADPDGEIGEQHTPETHIIPLVLAAADGGEAFKVFGDDYATSDGTCIRDFVHVSDIAAAHVRALKYLKADFPAATFNLGTGIGHSVMEVIDAVREISGRVVPYVVAPRRIGDPPILVADCSRANRLLEWHAQRSDLRTIIESSWRWHLRTATKAMDQRNVDVGSISEWPMSVVLPRQERTAI